MSVDSMCICFSRNAFIVVGRDHVLLFGLAVRDQ
jgi:hypothetical protein